MCVTRVGKVLELNDFFFVRYELNRKLLKFSKTGNFQFALNDVFYNICLFITWNKSSYLINNAEYRKTVPMRKFFFLVWYTGKYFHVQSHWHVFKISSKILFYFNCSYRNKFSVQHLCIRACILELSDKKLYRRIKDILI